MTLNDRLFSTLTAALFRYRPAMILVRLFLISSLVEGSHLAGTEMGYTALGNGQYRVTYFIYTDASSNAPGQFSPLEIRSASCNQYLSVVLSLQSNTGEPINGTCPINGSVQGFKKWSYSGVIQLPTQCMDWKISASECCRSSAITSIQQADRTALYTEVRIDNLTGVFSSPTFTNLPSFNLLAGQLNHCSQGIQADGLDSVLLYNVAPSFSSGNSVSYLPGYSERVPVRLSQPISIDAKNGSYTMLPLQQETGVVAFRADGYKNGHMVSSAYREYLIRSVATATHLPELSGFDGGTSTQMSVCAGQDTHFGLMTSDADAGSTVQVELIDSLPGASISVSAGRNPSLTFHWTAPVGAIGTTWYHFSLLVKDNDCPFNNSQIYTYRIKVSNWSVSVQTTPVTCLGVANGTATVTISGNDFPLNYTWSNSLNNTSFATDLSAGYQSVSISEPSGCSTTKTFMIAGNEGITPVSTRTINTTCQGGNDGTAAIVLPYPDSIYSIRWTSGETSSFISGLAAGMRSVTVTDHRSGCVVIRHVNIGFEHAAPQLSLGAPITACAGRPVTLIAGDSSLSHHWQDGSTGTTLTVAQSGTYSTMVTDAFGCSASASVNVTFQMCTGVNNSEATAALSLMPNPSHDFLTITNPGEAQTFESWSIHDISGRLVMNGTNELNGMEFRIDVSAFSEGLYVLTANGTGGATVVRFIKS